MVNVIQFSIKQKKLSNISQITNTKKTTKNIDEAINNDICNSKLQALNSLDF